MKAMVRICVLGLVACAMGTGCVSIYPRESLSFKAQDARIPRVVALYVAQEDRELTRDGRHASGKMTVMLGNALLPNAERSLSEVFDKIITVQTNTAKAAASVGADYLIQIKFNDDTAIKVGKSLYSTQQATLSVQCLAVRPTDNAPILKESVRVTDKEHGARLYHFLIIMWPEHVWKRAMRTCSERAMQQALEQINTLILENRDRFE